MKAGAQRLYVCQLRVNFCAMNVRTERVAAPEAPAEEAPVTAEASQRGYRLFAPLYDTVFGLSLHHGRRLAIDALDCRPGDRILDVGVGSGLSLPLYPTGARVTGIDISREMLAKAAQRVKRRRLSSVVALLEMDAERLTFPDASFDKAVVLFATAGLPDPVRAMKEIQRVCVPGATLVVANHFLSQRPVARFFDVLLSPIFQLLRYRADLDLRSFVAAANLDVIAALPANLFGYSTVLVCHNGIRGAKPSSPP
jgi:phosphatidylethanolamine/phosphatidyl-N-methylethanolamine N-methyltransferase